MGSNFKSAALEEHTVKAIRQWHADVKQKIRKKNHTSQSAHNNDDHSSTTLDQMSNTTAAISPDHPVSSHYTRSPTFAGQLTRFSTNTEIVEDYCQEIGQNIELDRSVALSSTMVHGH